MLLTYGLTTLLTVIGIWRAGSDGELASLPGTTIGGSSRDRVAQALLGAVWLLHTYAVVMIA